jgi:hypothetical protein
MKAPAYIPGAAIPTRDPDPPSQPLLVGVFPNTIASCSGKANSRRIPPFAGSALLHLSTALRLLNQLLAGGRFEILVNDLSAVTAVALVGQ